MNYRDVYETVRLCREYAVQKGFRLTQSGLNSSGKVRFRLYDEFGKMLGEGCTGNRPSPDELYNALRNALSSAEASYLDEDTQHDGVQATHHS
jgi:hypothetical protein